MKKLNSFADLKGFKGARAPRPLTPKTMRCNSCGGKMQNIEGTNVWVCTGETDKGEPCTNRRITKLPESVGGLV